MKTLPGLLGLLLAVGSLHADCLQVRTSDTTITGGTYSCVVVSAPRVVLDGVAVLDAPQNGVYIYASDVLLRNTTVLRSLGHGVLVGCPSHYPCSDTYVSRVVIDGGQFGYNTYTGIKFDYCGACAIRNAHIFYNHGSGIQINFAPVPFEVSDDEIDHNGFEDRNPKVHGIYTGGPGRIYHNIFHHNSGYGIHIWPAPSPDTTPTNPLDIRFNRLYANGGGVVIDGFNPGTVIYWHNAEYYNLDDGLLPG